jgi:hypothetical protein
MRRILISFEKGGSFPATLLDDDAESTCGEIWDILPITSTVSHSRWSGREVNLTLQTKNLPIEEHQTIYTSKGEIIYWRDWNSTKNPSEVLAIYYGAEETRSSKGPERVNVIGQIDFDRLQELKIVGERVWLSGMEQIRIDKLENASDYFLEKSE